MMELMIAFRNFVNVPKIWFLVTFLYVICKPCYASSGKKESESAARTQDRL